MTVLNIKYRYKTNNEIQILLVKIFLISRIGNLIKKIIINDKIVISETEGPTIIVKGNKEKNTNKRLY